MTVEPFWTEVSEGAALRQGDYLPGCSIPIVGPDLTAPGETQEVTTDQGDLIVITQSCDLEQRKAPGCVLAHLRALRFEAVNPAFARKGAGTRY